MVATNIPDTPRDNGIYLFKLPVGERREFSSEWKVNENGELVKVDEYFFTGVPSAETKLMNGKIHRLLWDCEGHPDGLKDIWYFVTYNLQ